MRKFLLFSLAFFLLLPLSGTFAQTSNFLERSSPVYSVGSSLFYVKEGILYQSADHGTSWNATNITTNVMKGGQGTIAVSPDNNQMALFLINADGNPSLYNSVDKGTSWAQQSLDGVGFAFSGKMYANLLIAPKSHQYYLFIYDFSKQTINIETTVLVSPDAGKTWNRLNSNNSIAPGFIIGSDSAKAFMNPLYYVNNVQSNGNTMTYFAKSVNLGQTFDPFASTGLPANAIVFWLSVDPTNPLTLYAPVVLADETTAVYRSIDGGATWAEIVNDKAFAGKAILGIQVHPLNPAVLYLYTEDKIYISVNSGITFTELPVKTMTDVNFMTVDQSSANYLYFVQNLTKELMRSQDGGLHWDTVTPKFEAQWVSQTQGDGTLVGSDVKPFLVKAGQKIQLQAQFKNSGSIIWKNTDFLKVGFYVYKDLTYSGPPEYNDPKTPSLFGKSWFADNSWGPSADGSTQGVRASLLKEASVAPGQVATFDFVFQVPANAGPSANADDASTKYDDRFIREDLTVAWGPNWMSNFTNGDPLNRAHIWMPARIVQ
ncbi:MAG: hypothetical protein WCP97_03785 [bacterium]